MTFSRLLPSSLPLIGVTGPSSRPRSADVARRLEAVVRSARVCESSEVLDIVELLRDQLALALSVHDRTWLPAEVFSRHAIHHASASAASSPAAALARMRGPDLYLALACGRQVAPATRELECSILVDIPRFVAPLATPSSSECLAQNVRRELRRRLLTSTETSRGQIFDYAGSVALRAWIRVAAVREAQALLRRT